MSKRPNSDKSGRAARRRKERQVVQAQRTIAREEETPSVGIDINALMSKMRGTIGALTVERDALSVQLEQRDSVIRQLGEQLARLAPSVPEPEVEEPPELGEVPPTVAEGPAEPTEQELTGEKS